MNLEEVASIAGILTFVGASIWGIYKRIPQVKVEITPIADNIFFGWPSDFEKPQRWTHRMRLSVFNHGYRSITFIGGELEITLGVEVVYKDMYGQTFKKALAKDESFVNLFIISDLKLPEESELKMILKDFKGKSYKSNVLALALFNPDLNPL